MLKILVEIACGILKGSVIFKYESIRKVMSPNRHTLTTTIFSAEASTVVQSSSTHSAAFQAKALTLPTVLGMKGQLNYRTTANLGARTTGFD